MDKYMDILCIIAMAALVALLVATCAFGIHFIFNSWGGA